MSISESHSPRRLVLAESAWILGALALGTLVRSSFPFSVTSSAELISLVSSVAIIPTAWWLARRWFAPDAGIVAAWAVALCELHILSGYARLPENVGILGLLWSVYGLWWSIAIAATGWSRVCVSVWSGFVALVAVTTSPITGITLAFACAASIIWALNSQDFPKNLLRDGVPIVVIALFATVGEMLVVDNQVIQHLPATEPDSTPFWNRLFADIDEAGDRYARSLTLFGLAGPTLIAAGCHCQRTGQIAGLSRLLAIIINVVILSVRPQGWLYVLVGLGLIAALLVWRKRHQPDSSASALAAWMLLVILVGLLLLFPFSASHPGYLLMLVTCSLLAGSIFWRRGWANLAQGQVTTNYAWIAPLVTVIFGWLVIAAVWKAPLVNLS